MRKINKIIIHHSWTRDGDLSDFEAIKRFHTSWRYDGNIITEKKGKEMKAKGIKGVTPPWSDIGYHFVIEKDMRAFENDDQFLNMKDYIIKRGRPEAKTGAHCRGHNSKTLGICIIGNFDKEVPNENQKRLVKKLVLYLKSKYDNLKVSYHRDYNKFKSCPGRMFSNKFKEGFNV